MSRRLQPPGSEKDRAGRRAARAARTPARARQSAWAALGEPQPGHEPHLDGLRALASVLIVFCHCVVWLPPALPDSYRAIPHGFVVFGLSCWFSVDVFFVLSGFLIGRILMRQLQQGWVSFQVFYVRRVFRVFPVYYLVLTVSVLFLSSIPEWHIL